MAIFYLLDAMHSIARSALSHDILILSHLSVFVVYTQEVHGWPCTQTLPFWQLGICQGQGR